MLNCNFDPMTQALIDDVAALPEEAKAAFKTTQGKCWHPASLRFGAVCVGCKTVFDSPDLAWGRPLPAPPV